MVFSLSLVSVVNLLFHHKAAKPQRHKVHLFLSAVPLCQCEYFLAFDNNLEFIPGF
jgi:hypothetical protein